MQDNKKKKGKKGFLLLDDHVQRHSWAYTFYLIFWPHAQLYPECFTHSAKISVAPQDTLTSSFSFPEYFAYTFVLSLITIHSHYLFAYLSSLSVHFSCSVVFDSLRPHESQHARPPCPSPTPGVHSNSRPSSR